MQQQQQHRRIQINGRMSNAIARMCSIVIGLILHLGAYIYDVSGTSKICLYLGFIGICLYIVHSGRDGRL